MNDSGNKFSKWILVTLVALLVFFWHREYQRGAMGRYLRSESFHTLALSIPKEANANNRVNLQWDERQMTIRVEVTDQTEFDRWLAISKRPDRSHMERFIIVRKGAEYHL